MRARQTRKIEQLGFVVIRLRNAQLGDADADLGALATVSFFHGTLWRFSLPRFFPLRRVGLRFRSNRLDTFE